MPLTGVTEGSITSLKKANQKTQSIMAKIAAGHRLNSAMDDAAGLAVSINLDAELRSLHQAGNNTVQAISLMRTAEGGMGSIADSLTRMSELAVMAGSSTYSSSQRDMIQTEIDSLMQQIDQVAGSTEYNGRPLLDGSSGQLTFQVGTGNTAADRIDFETPDLSTATLGINGGSVATPSTAGSLNDAVHAALDTLHTIRADVGAKMNVVETAANGLATAMENTAVSFSQIRDLDMASASTEKASGIIQLKMGLALTAQGSEIQSSLVEKLLG
jgi:flagellin